VTEPVSEYRFRIALHDTDSAGVLFFGHLFRHAHDAYEAAMARIGWPIDRLIRNGELGLPVVHADADYRRPLRHGEPVRVTLAVDAVARERFTVCYQFWRDDERAAIAKTVHVAIDPRSGGVCPLPPALIQALKGLSAERAAS
jgi:1,4-dihydroxy-2-naphthoyl-CoA hydrolase